MNVWAQDPSGHRRRTLLAFLPAIAWASLIFALSATPDLRFLPDSDQDLVLRKLGHMGIFGILALLAWLALARTTDLPRPWVWAATLAILYAATDELHQAVVARRHASWTDVVIDATGILVAIAVVLLLQRRRARPA